VNFTQFIAEAGPGIPANRNAKECVVKYDLYYPFGTEPNSVWIIGGYDADLVTDEGVDAGKYGHAMILDGWDNGKGKSALHQPLKLKYLSSSPRISVLASKEHSVRKSDLTKKGSAGIGNDALKLKFPPVKAGTKASFVLTTGVWVDNTNNPTGHGIATLKSVRSPLYLAVDIAYRFF